MRSRINWVDIQCNSSAILLRDPQLMLKVSFVIDDFEIRMASTDILHI